MKFLLSVLALLSLLALGLLGCSKSSSADVDASPIEKNFSSADDAIKAVATRAVNAVHSSDYDAAMAELLKLAADPKLTDSQKKAIAQVLDQLKAAITDGSKGAGAAADKAAGDAQKALGK